MRCSTFQTGQEPTNMSRTYHYRQPVGQSCVWTHEDWFGRYFLSACCVHTLLLDLY